jgi:hypothetical protein
MITAVAVDTRDSIRLCRTVSSGLVQAAVAALKRMGAAVRAKYIAALRHNGSKDVGRFPDYNPFWYWHGTANASPGSREPGGILRTTKLWKIHAPARGVVELDVVPKMQPVLERWQFGGGRRPDALRDWVRSISSHPQFNRFYHARLIPEGWPAVHALPPAPDQPTRDIVHPLTAAVAPLLPEWFDKALAKILSGKAKSWTQTRTASPRSLRRSA